MFSQGITALKTIIVAAYATVELVRTVYEIYPEAVSIKNSDAKFPLHEVGSTKAASDIVIFLCEKFPQACREKDKKGRYPMETIFGHGVLVTPEAFKALHAACPEAVTCPGSQGYLLVNCVATDSQHKHSLELVKLVYEAFPDAISQQDKSMKFPLHWVTAINYFTDFLYFIFLISWYHCISCFLVCVSCFYRCVRRPLHIRLPM